MEPQEQTVDREVAARVAALHARDDETLDGKIDAADLKLQLDRIEAKLELQDQQNRTLLRNQKYKFLFSVIVTVVLAAAVAVLWYQTTVAYQNILATCAQVNEIAATLQASLDKLNTADLDQIVQTLPDLMSKLSSIDTDALNAVLSRMPAFMDSVTALQKQLGGVSSLLGGLMGGA